MFTVINDSRFDAIARPAVSAGEAKEFLLEDIGFFIFYCAEQESTARNSVERKQWREKQSNAKMQLSIAQDMPVELIANAGLVLFVGEHVFQIRISTFDF